MVMMMINIVNSIIIAIIENIKINITMLQAQLDLC